MRAKAAAGVFFFRQTLSTKPRSRELFADQMALCHTEYTMKTLVSLLAIVVTLAFMQTAEAGDDKHRWRHGKPNIDINILIPSAYAVFGYDDYYDHRGRDDYRYGKRFRDRDDDDDDDDDWDDRYDDDDDDD